MEGLTSASQQVSATPRPAATDAARLAGTMTQAVLPLVGHTVTLDSVVLARAAAWLCLAEQRMGTKCGAEWGPILALANREAASREAWLGMDKAFLKSKAATRFWDVFIRLPLAPEGLPFIMRPENRLYAAPLFTVYSVFDRGYGELLVENAPKLFPKNIWERLHDYAPVFNHSAINHIWGALVAAIALVVIGHAGGGVGLNSVIVGVSVVILVIAAKMPMLSTIPAGVYGYAATAAAVLMTANVLGGDNAVFKTALLVVVSMILGNIFGYVSEKIASSLAKA